MITNTSSRRENKRERERERERVYSDTHTHHIPYVTFFKHLTLFELIRTFPISKKAKFFCESLQILSIIYTLQLTADKRYARAREISFPFFLSLFVEDRRRLRDSPRRLSLSCVFSNDDRVFSERFLNSRTVVFYPILSNFASEPTRSREKTKILHSPLIEHGRRRDQSNELDHPVVAPRSVHGVSDAGAPMMQSSSSSLSSCVRNVFLALFFEKSKSPFEKAFFAEKVLGSDADRSFLIEPTIFFLFFSFFFSATTTRKK